MKKHHIAYVILIAIFIVAGIYALSENKKEKRRDISRSITMSNSAVFELKNNQDTSYAIVCIRLAMQFDSNYVTAFNKLLILEETKTNYQEQLNLLNALIKDTPKQKHLNEWKEIVLGKMSDNILNEKDSILPQIKDSLEIYVKSKESSFYQK